VKESKFFFDYVFDHNDDNIRVYEKIVDPLIDLFFNGNKVTFFAYGQTGSGKTWTMMGKQCDDMKSRPRYQTGLYDLASFKLIEHSRKLKLDLELSFYEIYCNKLYDLLNNKKELDLLEDAKKMMNVKGLT